MNVDDPISETIADTILADDPLRSETELTELIHLNVGGTRFCTLRSTLANTQLAGSSAFANCETLRTPF